MQPDERALLLSLRPRYARLLLDGTKTVELRRVRPAAQDGMLVLLYASSPTRTLVGTARVVEVEAASLEAVWRHHGPDAAITREEFDAYFVGVETAVAITLASIQPLQRPRPLKDLRDRVAGFRPPQSFRYLDRGQVAALI